MVEVGSVATFRDVAPDKAHVMKIAEEVMEVYSAWEARFHDGRAVLDSLEHQRRIDAQLERAVLDECADVIQATCNLIAALGVEDFAPYMDECRGRNEKRGRM